MSNTQVEQFYDDFSHKLITDYLTGNLRMEQAIRYAIAGTPTHAQSTLDIGCGIGWSSHELSRHYPNMMIKAIDLSTELLAVGTTLFSQPNISFVQADITSSAFAEEGKYDVVLMLDVYEHISASDRVTFHKAINRLLNPSGVVILTCPSKFHQKWLRTEQPEGLQPVDEDVTLETLDEFAKTVQGEVIDFSYLSLWQQYDYFHARLQKNAEVWGAGEKKPMRKQNSIALEAQLERIQRIQMSKYATDLQAEIAEIQAKLPEANKLKQLFKRLK